MRRSSTPWRDNNPIAIVMAVLICFGCLLLACGGPTAVSFAVESSGQTDLPVNLIPMCAWARQGAVGLWWNASVTPSRAISSSSRFNAICVAVPWSALLPTRGRPAVEVTP